MRNKVYSDSIAGSATDPDDEALIYTKVSGPAWLTVSTEGALSGTPAAEDAGMNSFTIQVRDGTGSFDTGILNIMVNSKEGDEEVILFKEDFETGEVGTGGWTYSGILTVDGTSFTGDYAARVDDTGYLQKVVSTAGYNSIKLAFARYTYAYDSGEYLFIEWSTDGINWKTIESYQADWQYNEVSLGAGAAQQSMLLVRFRSNANGYYERFRIDDVAIAGTRGDVPPNRAPAFNSDPVTVPNANVGSSYYSSLGGSASDPDNDPLTYTKVKGPHWLNISSDGALSGTPGAGDIGATNFTLQVADGRGGFDTALLNITVSEEGGKTLWERNVPIRHDGRERTYDVMIPACYDGGPTPLVVDIHGYKSTKEDQEDFSGWRELAEIEGFIVAWPQGYHNSWNAGDTCCGNALKENVDDEGFIRTMVAKINSDYNIDDSRIYATGISNGGGMAQLLGIKGGDLFAAVAPYSMPALIPVEGLRRPITVSITHAAGDTLVPYVGGGLLNFPSANAGFNEWRDANGCSGNPVQTWYHNSGNYCMTYRNCDDGTTVTLCTVQGDHLLYDNIPGVHLSTITGWNYMKNTACSTCEPDPY